MRTFVVMVQAKLGSLAATGLAFMTSAFWHGTVPLPLSGLSVLSRIRDKICLPSRLLRWILRPLLLRRNFRSAFGL